MTVQWLQFKCDLCLMISFTLRLCQALLYIILYIIATSKSIFKIDFITSLPVYKSNILKLLHIVNILNILEPSFLYLIWFDVYKYLSLITLISIYCATKLLHQGEGHCNENEWRGSEMAMIFL